MHPLHTVRSDSGEAADARRVSTILVRALIEAVEAHGTSGQRFLSEAGVSLSAYDAPYAWISAAEFDRLIELAVTVTRHPALGLHWNQCSAMLKFDLVATTTAYAPSLRQAIACVLRLQPLLSETPELSLCEGSDSVWLRFVPAATTELAARVRSELSISSLVRLVRHLGAPSAAVQRITFAHAAPAYVDEYVRLLGSQIEFGHAYTSLEIDARWLDHRVAHANLELHQYLSKQAEDVMARIHESARYADQLREWLSRVYPHLPSQKAAARAMALSERSLRRRLAEEGFSYSVILDETRQRLAEALLVDRRRSIKQVASEVGFHSGAAFARAFERWTGERPAAYRDARLHAMHVPSGADEGPRALEALPVH